jgi:protein-tyrosine phosphatase
MAMGPGGSAHGPMGVGGSSHPYSLPLQPPQQPQPQPPQQQQPSLSKPSLLPPHLAAAGAEPAPLSRQLSARARGARGVGGPVPAGWRECARHGRVTHGLLPMKTFLGSAFDSQLEPAAAWTPSMVCELALPSGAHVRLVVDLCATVRYYEPSALPPGVAYHKLVVPGRQLPPPSAVDEFCAVVSDYLSDPRWPNAVVAVHCTHGVNRTGFMVASYLVRRHRLSVREAVHQFTLARFPGMWRQEMIDALHAQYGGPPPEPAAAQPPWADDEPELQQQQQQQQHNGQGHPPYQHLHAGGDGGEQGGESAAGGRRSLLPPQPQGGPPMMMAATMGGGGMGAMHPMGGGGHPSHGQLDAAGQWQQQRGPPGDWGQPRRM